MLAYIESQRREKKLVHNHYVYTKKRIRQKGVITWRCEVRSCNAIVKVLDESITEEPYKHNHDAIEGLVDTIKIRADITTAALISEDPPSRIIARKLAAIPSQFLPLLPQIPSISRNVRYKRQKQQDALTPNDLFNAVDGNQFMRHKEREFVVFAADVDIEWLATCRSWFVDGTFKMVPPGFYQLYTIHGHNGRLTKACVFILMSGKSERDYRIALNKINVLFPCLSPEHITLDFETQAIKAFRTFFPSAIIYGCSFHFNQAAWRALQRNCVTTPVPILR